MAAWELHGRHHWPDADNALLVRRAPAGRPCRRRGLPRPRRPPRHGRHRRPARPPVPLPVGHLTVTPAMGAGGPGAGLTAVEAGVGRGAAAALALALGAGALGERLVRAGVWVLVVTNVVGGGGRAVRWCGRWGKWRTPMAYVRGLATHPPRTSPQCRAPSRLTLAPLAVPLTWSPADGEQEPNSREFQRVAPVDQ